jgi:reactive chlorine resistance protein C
MINGYRIDSHRAFPFIRRRRHPPTNSQYAFKTAVLSDNYEPFIGVAQTFGDTGVAAFKGQLPSLTGHGEVLTTALKIHSVEARHAAEVRHLHAGHTSTKGIKMRASTYLDIAERTIGARGSLALLRWALAIVFLWFGGMKFTSYEAHGNAPLIDHSPVMSWLNVAFGVQGASDVIGVIELSTAAMLILGSFYAAASALGAAMASVTFVITLSFFLTTPGVAEPTAGGFPAISAPIGQFLLKDLVLLAASLNLLLASIRPHPK